MTRPNKSELWEVLLDEAAPTDMPAGRPASSQRRQFRPDHKPKRSQADILGNIVEREEPEQEIQFTYRAARHEKIWMMAALSPFYLDHIIQDVLSLVKGGKEATVYCCQANPAMGMELLAAKIYRPRIFRSLKNDAIYQEGRAVLDGQGKPVRDGRSQRAIAKKTRVGAEMVITSWIEHEYQTLTTLHRAGARVPRPVAHQNNTILMEYIGEAGNPAPALNDVALESHEARPLFDLLLGNVALLLSHDRVHADLSAYNVLYWDGQVTIIDFPQVVDPLYNPRGYDLLRRDIERLCSYFARYGIRANPAALATDLWSKYLRGEL